MCSRVYSDPGFPELEEFEDFLDIHLQTNDKLTADERRVRDNLIEGVELMCQKVNKWRRGD